MTAEAVTVLVIDWIWKTVSAVTGTLSSTLASPYAFS